MFVRFSWMPLSLIHIFLVCGFWQGTSGWAHPVFLFLINKMEQIGQYLSLIHI